ncbi:MAG: hypothetical protein IIX20_06325 [Alistipes sp.]|nr:hypothetical protein [Alistipes sp.]
MVSSNVEVCNNVSKYDGVKYGYRAAEFSNIDELYTNSRTEAFGYLLKSTILFGSETLSEDNYMKVYDKALRVRRVIVEYFDKLFADFDAVLLPVCSKTKYTKADTDANSYIAYEESLLQTSTLELTIQDAQTEVMALSLNPDHFRSSTDDAVNIERIPVSRMNDFRNAKYACSYYDYQNSRISESPTLSRYFRVITFNRILKYGSFPLADIIRDMLRMGEEEMRCPVEIEFAVNMDVPAGEMQIFNLLQIRPIIRNEESAKLDWSKVDTSGAVVYSENALGIGLMRDIKRVVYMKFDKFSSLYTQKIADELMEINNRMRADGEEYVLIGTGRWGSSDPNLGVPVKWAHISQARVIVESALPNFNVEASQGTHFFQNVTSLGVGYLSLDPSHGDGELDVEQLDAMPAWYDGEYMRCVEFPDPLYIYVDGQSKKGIVKPAPKK